MNQPVIKIIPDQINSNIESVESFSLSAEQSSFSLRFSAIANILNSDYYYTYRLKGFQDEWITPKAGNVATYTNIPPGKYIFEVKAGTKSNQWDIASKSIAIKIAPPLWKQWWAYVLYVLLIILLVYGVYKWLHLKSRFAIEAWKHQQNKELHEVKMNFFSKMAHEIQTPITLITAPIEDMLKNATEAKNDALEQRLNMIWNNAQRLSRIASELTTIRNRELGKLQLRVIKGDFITAVQNIALSFKEQARFKTITFIEEYPDEQLLIWYDLDKLEHILYNLLSNALKFTPVSGSVTLTINLSDNKEFVKVTVSDSGPGIASNELDKIFDIFYQTETGKQIGGTGIGLALTKELVTLHHGEISAFSKEHEGSTFMFTLPISEEVYPADEKFETAPDGYAHQTTSPVEKTFPLKNDKTVLIVDDNIDMQIYLKSIFEGHYHVILAENGEKGIIAAEEHSPDLIISDVMMPVLSGIDMCKALQKKTTTKHIPIILLTAKNNTQTKISGLASGAISFIQKPFNNDELQLKVKNILAQQEKLLANFKTGQLSSPQNIEATSQNELFLERLVGEIESRLENTDFKLEDLADIMGMSYSALYRKCLAVTGKTLVDFVRSYKLKKAAVLITKYNYPIAEAAFMVGFSDAKYFTKCFKNEFGITPNNFKREASIDTDSYLSKYDL